MTNGSRTAAIDLPPYQALLAVDMKDFSGHRSRDHETLTEMIPQILDAAFTRAGRSDIWAERSFPRTTGDGFVAGFRPALLPYLLNPLLQALQDELAQRNRAEPVGSPPRPVRMRVSINVGPVTDSGPTTMSVGSGAARVETHRLLDAQPVKDLLARSTDVTCIAAIVSERAVEDAVLSGYSGEDDSIYVRVPVEVKTYRGDAYLRVPSPSGDLLRHGFETPANAESPAAEPGVGATGVTISSTITNPRGPVHGGYGDQINHLRSERSRGRRDDR